MPSFTRPHHATAFAQREVEKHQLFGMAKMLLSILWQLRNGTGQNTRIESPELTMRVEESLNTLERLAAVRLQTSSAHPAALRRPLLLQLRSC